MFDKAQTVLLGTTQTVPHIWTHLTVNYKRVDHHHLHFLFSACIPVCVVCGKCHFLLNLAWFDVTVTKPPLDLGLKLGEHVVYFKLFRPSPIVGLPVYLSRGSARGRPLKQYYRSLHPCMALSIQCSWCVVLYKAAFLKRHCQIHLWPWLSLWLHLAVPYPKPTAL